MKEQLLDFIDEAIKLEMNLSRLYSAYGEHFKEDYPFWFKLEIEEKNHAALLKSGKDFVRFNQFPPDIFPPDINQLKETNTLISEKTDWFILNPNRKMTFELAIMFEESAGETHFQKFMQSDSDDKLVILFQKLNRMDKDHAMRITEYYKSVLHTL